MFDEDALTLDAAAFSPDGRKIVTIGLGTIKYWEAHMGAFLK